MLDYCGEPSLDSSSNVLLLRLIGAYVQHNVREEGSAQQQQHNRQSRACNA